MAGRGNMLRSPDLVQHHEPSACSKKNAGFPQTTPRSWTPGPTTHAGEAGPLREGVLDRLGLEQLDRQARSLLQRIDEEIASQQEQ